MNRPSHLRIVASGDDWATELRRRQDNLRRFEERRAETERREKQTRPIPLRHLVLATKDGRAVRPEYRPRIDTVDGPPAWLDAVCKLFIVVMAVASVVVWFGGAF